MNAFLLFVRAMPVVRASTAQSTIKRTENENHGSPMDALVVSLGQVDIVAMEADIWETIEHPRD